MSNLRVDGLDKLLRTLKNLPDEFKGDPVRRSLRAGAEVMRADAARLAPVDTGNLSDSIIMKPIPPKYLPRGAADGVEIMGSRKGKAGDQGNAYYYIFVEFGTVNQSAQPFLRPAFESTKQQAVDAYAQEFRKTLDRSVKKAQR